MQKLIVKCGLCNQIIATVEKPFIIEEDVALYTEMSSCATHNVDNIVMTIEDVNESNT